MTVPEENVYIFVIVSLHAGDGASGWETHVEEGAGVHHPHQSVQHFLPIFRHWRKEASAGLIVGGVEVI